MSTITPPKERSRLGSGSGTGDAWRVIVLNDNHNTFEGVAFALAKTIPGVDYDRGMALANRIHTTGQAIVWSGHRERAELYHDQLGGFGLTLAPLESQVDTEHGIRRVFEAFRGGDPRALFEVIAEDAVWLVNGTVPVAQEYRGRARIFDLFRETRRLTDGTYLSTLRWLLAGDEHAVAVYRAQGRRLGRELDIDQVLLIDHEDGVWKRVVAIPSDPPAFEAFWA